MWIENRKILCDLWLPKQKSPPLLKKNPEKNLSKFEKPGQKGLDSPKKSMASCRRGIPWVFLVGVDPSPAGWSSYPYGNFQGPPPLSAAKAKPTSTGNMRKVTRPSNSERRTRCCCSFFFWGGHQKNALWNKKTSGMIFVWFASSKVYSKVRA